MIFYPVRDPVLSLPDLVFPLIRRSLLSTPDVTILSVATAGPDKNMAGLRGNQGQVHPHGQQEAHRDGNKRLYHTYTFDLHFPK